MNFLFFFLICQCITVVLLAQYSTELIENPTEPDNDWIGICTASSGQFVAASGHNSGVYTSNDYGYEWTLSLDKAPNNWEGIACSGSGQQLCTINNVAGIFVSQNFGMTWKNVSSIGGYRVASSSSGQYLYAAGPSGVSSSDNFGGNWSSHYFVIMPKTVSCSSSGQYVATAGYDYGFMYISNNFGVNFSISYDTREMWTAVSFDASGQYLTAAGSSILFTSSDYGKSWTTGNIDINCLTLSTSADGSFRLAGTNSGYYYSLDNGTNWIAVSSDITWTCMSTSASGQYFYGVAYYGGIYGNYYSPTSQPTDVPTNLPSSTPSNQPSTSPTIYQQYSYTLVEMVPTIQYYHGMTGSSSGQYLYAVTYSKNVIISDNFGNSVYQKSVGVEEWTSIACSDNGQYVYVVSNFAHVGVVYQSNDFGSNWNVLNRSTSTSWWYLATNGSGQAVYASGYDEDSDTCCIFYSIDFGTSWNCTAIPIALSYFIVACSTSGKYVTIVANDVIYWSSDFGINYHQAAAPSQDWVTVALSSSGQYQIVGGGSYDGVFISTNYGLNWSATVLSETEWTSVAVSGSGQFMFAAMGETGSVYSSVDYGVTWSSTDSPDEYWTGLTVSSSGEHLAAVVYGGGLYTNYYSVPTSMPSKQPSSQPNAAPTGVPSCQPTSQPSLQPHTSFPTSQPSVCPSVCPSSQPSTYPTFSSGVFDSSSVVLSYASNSSFTFNNLGCGSHAFVSASILVSYLDATTSGFITVWASTDSKSVLVGDKCAPSSVCGSVVCAVNVNVTSVVSCSGGGSVTLLASTVNADEQSGVDTLCTYRGTPGIQYALSYELSVNPQPTAYPSPAPSVAGPGDLIFEASPNTPFYVIVTFTLLFMALGVVLVRLRDKSGSTLDEMKVSSVCLDLGMIGYHLASEVFYIIVLYNGQPTLGALIILIRLTSVLPAIYFLVVSVGPTRYSQHYGSLLNKHNLYKNASVYSVVIVLMLFEHCLIKYFPWNKSEYIQQSKGFPDHWIFQCCMSFKFCQLLASLVIQIIVLSYSDAYLFNDGADQIALALVLLYLVSSVLTVVVFAITNLVRWKAGVESSKDSSDNDKQQKQSNEDDDGDKIENPFHSEGVGSELRVFKKEEWKGEKAAAAVAGYVTREYLEERESFLQIEFKKEFDRRDEEWRERFSRLEGKFVDSKMLDN